VRLLVTAACILAPILALGAEPPAVITLLEGAAVLFRGTSRYAFTEGVRVQSGDIIEVDQKGLVQIEFADGAILSLGSGSRFYAGSLQVAGGGGGISEFYLMQGWSKFATGVAAAPFRYTTPLFSLSTAEATVVMQISESDARMFVESGEVRFADGFAKGAATSPVRVRSGEFYSRRAGQKGAVAPRPIGNFVAVVPKVYLDNLPPRIARYKDREVAPRRIEELTYAEVEMWLKSPPAIRQPIMQRFVHKADEPEFRQALIANMKFHPEWDRIVFPEKYRPKPPPEAPLAKPPSSSPQPQARSGSTPASDVSDAKGAPAAVDGTGGRSARNQ